MDVLNIDHLKKNFGAHEVIRDLSFRVPEHCIFGFIGQNGAGKTTTMKMILGLLKADSGTITISGEKVRYGQTRTNRYIGYLPDVPEFYGYMRPKEYLTLCGKITGMTNLATMKKAGELLEMVGLASVNKKIGGFSRGMKQRLGIAQALLNEPKLLICDEPTSALDPVGRKEILDILEQVKGKTTVVFSTHILSDVERICDRIAVLHEGTLVLSGTLDEIKAKRRSDSLLIEFAGKREMDRFRSLPDLVPLMTKAEVTGPAAVIHCSDIAKAESSVISALEKEKLLPVKLELLEPTLESLFLEVVK